MINMGDLQGQDEKNVGFLDSFTRAKLKLVLNACVSKLNKLQDGEHSL